MTETYLTDELNVRRRPAERFWKNIKIKRLNNVPAEKGENKKVKLIFAGKKRKIFFANEQTMIERQRLNTPEINVAVTHFAVVWSYLNVHKPNWKSRKSIEC